MEEREEDVLGTMKVREGDKVVRRPIDHMEHVPSNGRSLPYHRPVPVLKAGERAIWEISSHIPIIIIVEASKP